MTTIYTHPGKLGWYPNEVPGSVAVRLPSKAETWEQVNAIVQQVAAKSPEVPPLDVFALIQRSRKRR